MMKPNTDWIETIKKLNIDPTNLNLNQLKAFKDADKYLTGFLDGPKEWVYLIRCFRFLTVFAWTLIFQNTYPSLTKCWKEMSQLFLHDEMLNDGLFVESWIFCDFPFGPERETALHYFEDFIRSSEKTEDFQIFIDQLKVSRLGLYQEILSSSKAIKLRELFTDKVVTIVNTVQDFEKGEIFLTRLIEIEGKTYSFCDPKCWPKDFKIQIDIMVANKLYYFAAPTLIEQYELFMKHAGPYWMSCVMSNNQCPILSPNHYLSYL